MTRKKYVSGERQKKYFVPIQLVREQLYTYPAVIQNSHKAEVSIALFKRVLAFKLFGLVHRSSAAVSQPVQRGGGEEVADAAN